MADDGVTPLAILRGALRAAGDIIEDLENGGTVTHNFAGSSALEGLEYEPMSQLLTVTFLNGAEYEYSGVSATTVAAFIGASSPGSFWHANIKGT